MKKIMIYLVLLLLLVSMTYAYPLVIYNKYRVNQTEIDRFKTVMETIPEDYFKSIDTITIRNRPHLTQDWEGQYSFKGYKEYITLYNFKYNTNEGIHTILMHELGHANEFHKLTKYMSISEISNKGLNETYAENWNRNI